MTFKEVFEGGLTADDITKLKEISKGKDWIILRDLIERHIMRWTYNLLTEEMANEADKLKSLRGFVEGYRTIKRIIESKDEPTE